MPHHGADELTSVRIGRTDPTLLGDRSTRMAGVQQARGRAADTLQLRRALRALLAQRGGAMLLTLHGVHAGVTIRMECALQGAEASVSLRVPETTAAQFVRAAHDCFEAECIRAGYLLARLACSAPATRLAAA